VFGSLQNDSGGPAQAKKISEMYCWDGLYIKLFDLRCPCYVVVTLCQKNNDYIKNCVGVLRYEEIQRINEIPTGYHQAQIKTYEKKCLSQPGGSTYDVHCFGMQCFLNAKLRVDLFGGGAMVPDGITVQVKRMFSRTRDSQSNDDIPNQETETSVFDGNACELIDEDNVDLIRRTGAPHDGQDTVKTLRTIIWYKRACITQTTQRLSLAVSTSKKDVNKNVVIEQVSN